MAKKKEMCSLENHEPGAGIVLMKLEELHSFEGHPFKVERNQELFELRCSIEKEGVLVPLLVRKNPHGDGYEIIAGHRRKEAALWAGLTEVPVIIRELDDDQSVMKEKVWQCNVSRSMIDKYMNEYLVGNIKTTKTGAELRIISIEKPTEDAVAVEKNLEDAFLFYFGEKSEEKQDA